MVSLRMNSRIIQRILRIRNTQETCTLLEHLLTQTLNLKQLLPRSISTILRTILHDIFSQSRADTGNIAQEITTCSIEVYTHAIHAALYGIVQLLLQKPLIHIMLILTHT